MADSSSILIRRGLLIEPVQASATDRQRAPGELFLKENVRRADIRISAGRIEEISEELTPAQDEVIIEANNLWVSPGFIDLHAHLRDFKQSRTEDIESGSRAAARGGYTTVVAMPDSDPPIDSTQALSLLQRKIETSASIEVLPSACLTIGCKGEQLTEMAQLADMGAVVFCDADIPTNDLGIMRRALEYARLVGRPVMSYPENFSLAENGVMNESAQSTRLGLAGRPNLAEAVSIAQILEIIRATGCRLHLSMVSTKEAVRLLRSARSENLPVSAGVASHNLALLDEDITEYDTNFKLTPPLRGKQDQMSLIEAIQEGLIEVISSNHSPHSVSEKMRPFSEAPTGATALETAFSLAFEKLVIEGPLSANELLSLFTTGPASVLDLPKPVLKQGVQANLTVLSPAAELIYDSRAGASKASCSPFNGRKLRGAVVATISRGRLVYREKELALSN